MDTRPTDGRGNDRPTSHARKKTRLSRGARLARATLVFVVLLALIVGALYGYSQYRYHQINRLSVGGLSPTVANQPINILLVGSNTRIGLKPNEAKYFGSATQVGGARSDVTMIAHFDPVTDQVSLVSIPRDLFMPIPGTTTANRIDAELNVSPGQLIKTVEQDLGIPIQHFVELNFDSFQNVVQALGGIRMYFPMPVRDAYSGLNVTTTGCRTLNGFQALQVVRARHLYYEQNGTWIEDPLGDLSRIRRDHEFLKVLASQVKSRGLSDPFTANAVLSSIVKYLTVDSNFTFGNMLSLVTKYRHASASNAPTATLPIAIENGPNMAGYYYNGANYGDIVFPAQPQDSQILQKYLGVTVPQIAKSTIQVSVLNGSGAYQQATTTAQALKALGYRIGTIGNYAISSGYTSQSVNPTETIIRYEPGHLAQAEVLQSSLSGSVIMGQVRHTSTGSPVELITGTQLVVAGSGGSGGSSSSNESSSSSTPSPSSASSPSSATTAAPVTVPATQSNQGLQPWDPRACP